MDNDIMEIRERLAKIETLLTSNYAALEARVKKLEDNNTWLTRAVIGEVIGIIFLAVFKF